MPLLSLSGRIIEVQYRSCEMSVPDFLRLARGCGYDAVELRATQLPSGTMPAEAAEFRRLADGPGLRVSCCMPPAVTADEAGLQALAQFLGLARLLACDTLKLWVGDVDWLRRACDLVRPHGVTLIAQTHTGGPFETVDSCLATLARLDRSNFGLQYDPANLFEAQQEYGEEAVRRLGSHIRQLSVQNLKPARAGEPDTWQYEGRHYRRCLPGDADGLDYASVFRGLRAIGFDGCVTLNEPKPTLMETEPFARRMCQELRRQFGVD